MTHGSGSLLEQIDEDVNKRTFMSNSSNKIKKKRSTNKLRIKDLNLMGMRKSTSKISKKPSKTSVINLADRVTFSNFYKDGNIEPI